MVFCKDRLQSSILCGGSMKLKYSTRDARKHRGGNVVYYDTRDNKVRSRPAYDSIYPIGIILCWSYEYKMWCTNTSFIGYEGGSSNYPAKNINHRKFRRLLKQWSKYLPPGIEFRTCGRFRNFYITGWTK